ISAALHSGARQVPDLRLRRLQDAELWGKTAPQEVYEVLWSGAPAPEEKPAAPTRSYSLVLLEPGAGTTTIFALKQAETLLGRDRGEIRFPKDPMISSAHARFRVDAEGLEMEDLSASGVFLRLRQPARLQHGDLFLVGKKLFEFLAGDAPGQAQLRLSHRDLSLREPETVIGRREGNLVFPDDPLLSGRHACLRREGDAFYLEDLKSTNGTFLKVRGKARLADGDEVLCGSKLLRVRVAEEPSGIR
ncbi:MAG: FHA domain-containing protein, partial [Candidatus Acidoferrales bacterium]